MNIAIIKLGALGDIMYAMDAIASVQAYYPTDRITLIIRKPYAQLAERMPYFTDIVYIPKGIKGTHKWIQFMRIVQVLKGYHSVFDFQMVDKTALWYWGVRIGLHNLQWYGHVPFWDSHHLSRKWRKENAYNRFGSLLHGAHIPYIKSDIGWLLDTPTQLPLTPYVCIVPGCSGNVPAKVWPIHRYAEISTWLYRTYGLYSVIVGGKEQVSLGRKLVSTTPAVLDYTGKTTLFEMAYLLKHAIFVLGNDTGPVHMAGLCNTPTLMLLGKDGDVQYSHDTTQFGFNRMIPLWGSRIQSIAVQKVQHTLTEQIIHV